MTDPLSRTEERMAIPEMAAKTEPELLEAITYQDHAARVVYADWLEEQGDHERAEYVRLQDMIVALPPTHRDYKAVENRLHSLDVKLDAAWRVLVARPRIRNCRRQSCPAEWGSLAPSERSDVRICMQCHTRLTYFMHSVTVRSHGPEPVVVDSVYHPDGSDDWRRR